MITVIITYNFRLSIEKGKKVKKFFLLLFLFIIFSSCSHQPKNDVRNNNLTEVDKPIVATWVNYNEINDLIKQADTQSDFNILINKKITCLKEYNINTIFLQVRAFDDCFYKSKLCSVSKYCSYNNKLRFDVLQTFINICKEQNIEIHAWINPYRISNNNNIEEVSENSYAGKIIKSNKNDERIVVTDNGIFYNPAYRDNQSYILNCVREIICNYDIDGVHIDDYFYLSSSDDIDSFIYNEYLNNGGRLSKAEYRRNNINMLVTSIYQIIKSYDNNILFSISPSADIQNNYNSYFADIELWANTDGYVDYIIPQLYFGFDNEKMPFNTILDEWLKIDKSKNRIIVGLAMYKVGKEDIYAGSGKQEWIENDDVLFKQIKNSIAKGVVGISFYSASYLYNEKNVENLINERVLIKEIVNNWNY